MHIHVLAAGEFGGEVAARLSGLLSHVTTTPLAGLEGSAAYWPAADAYVIAAWRPVPALCRLIDELAHSWKRPFVPVVADGSLLRVGPVVVPQKGPCHGCYEKRRLQHSRTADWDKAVTRHYDSSPEHGPKGFLAPVASIAAIQTARTLRDLEQAAGSVWTLDVVTRAVSLTSVVGVHGCPRCGLRRDESNRSFQTLQSEVLQLLPCKLNQ